MRAVPAAWQALAGQEPQSMRPVSAARRNLVGPESQSAQSRLAEFHF